MNFYIFVSFFSSNYYSKFSSRKLRLLFGATGDAPVASSFAFKK